MKDQSEVVIRAIHAEAQLQARVQAEAKVTAHGLLEGYLGPDHKVLNISDFYSALVQA